MRIGIDIDDTITDTIEKIKSVMIKNHIEHLEKNFDSYTDDELKKYGKLIVDNVEDILSNCSLKPNAVEIINKLKNDGNEIYFITARSNDFSKRIYDITVKYLKNNNIKYDKLLFNYKKKKDVCIEYNVDVMIDDNCDIINSLKNTNVFPIIFNNKFNIEQECIGVRVNNWNEIYNVINNIKTIDEP